MLPNFKGREFILEACMGWHVNKCLLSSVSVSFPSLPPSFSLPLPLFQALSSVSKLSETKAQEQFINLIKKSDTFGLSMHSITVSYSIHYLLSMVSYQTLDLVLVIVIHTSNLSLYYLVTFVSLLSHALHLSWYMKFVSTRYTCINCFGKNDWDIFKTCVLCTLN